MFRCNRHGAASATCDDACTLTSHAQAWHVVDDTQHDCGCVTTRTRHALTATVVVMCDACHTQALAASQALRDARMAIHRTQVEAMAQRRTQANVWPLTWTRDETLYRLDVSMRCDGVTDVAEWAERHTFKTVMEAMG